MISLTLQLSAVPLSTAAAPGASEAGNSDEEDARRSELELSAMHGMLQATGAGSMRCVILNLSAAAF